MKKLFIAILCLLGHASVAQSGTSIIVIDGHTYAEISPGMTHIEVENVEPDHERQRGPTDAVIWTETGEEIPLGPITLFYSSDTSETSLYRAGPYTFALYDEHHTMSSSSAKYLLDAEGRPIKALILTPIKEEEVAYLRFDKNDVTTNLEADPFQIVLETEEVKWRSQGGFHLPVIPSDVIDMIDTVPDAAYGVSIQDERGREYGFFLLDQDAYDVNGVKTHVYQPDGSPYSHFTMKGDDYLFDSTIVVTRLTVLRIYEMSEFKGVKKTKHAKRDRTSKDERKSKRKSERAPDVIQY